MTAADVFAVFAGWAAGGLLLVAAWCLDVALTRRRCERERQAAVVDYLRGAR